MKRCRNCAAVIEPPFAAKWLVKSQDQAGDHSLAVECEDTAGNVVSKGQPVSVTLPATGSVAWSQVYPAIKGSAEAADADAPVRVQVPAAALQHALRELGVASVR